MVSAGVSYLSNISYVMLVMVDVDTLVYILVVSNEYILVSRFISMSSKPGMRYLLLLMLYKLGSFTRFTIIVVVWLIVMQGYISTLLSVSYRREFCVILSMHDFLAVINF